MGIIHDAELDQVLGLGGGLVRGDVDGQRPRVEAGGREGKPVRIDRQAGQGGRGGTAVFLLIVVGATLEAITGVGRDGDETERTVSAPGAGPW